MSKTLWKTGYKCVECEHKLSYDQVIYSSGRCPYCGYKHEFAGTIVENNEFAYRYNNYFNMKFPFFHQDIEIREDD